MSGISWNAFLRQAQQQLTGAGIEDAKEEARWLVRLIGKVSSSDLILRGDNHISSATLETLQQALQRRLTREPLQHIMGETEFYGLTLTSDKRALIPRPDSECVVDLALEKIPSDAPYKLADLGAGSGALLIALLKQREGATGIAVERSEAANNLITENLERHALTDRAMQFMGSWSEWKGWGDCDLIISNPPYIESAVIPTLTAEVRDHDPLEALDGGEDGLNAYSEIISIARKTMKRGARLVLEIGYDQRETVSELLIRNGFDHLEHRKDLGGLDRAIAAQQP
ncbi:MAG: peptide chain release factor N(5)-glutamine methyltransferase [Pseudomonadota bacterium]